MADTVLCGGTKMSPICSECPKTNEDSPDSWCSSAHCSFDLDNSTCKERGMRLLNNLRHLNEMILQ